MTEHSCDAPHGIPHMLRYAYGSLDPEAPPSLDSLRCCTIYRLRVLFMKDMKHNRRNITNYIMSFTYRLEWKPSAPWGKSPCINSKKRTQKQIIQVCYNQNPKSLTIIVLLLFVLCYVHCFCSLIWNILVAYVTNKQNFVWIFTFNSGKKLSRPIRIDMAVTKHNYIYVIYKVLVYSTFFSLF
jgi:hypothetical protein